jgi:hypothetical protein
MGMYPANAPTKSPLKGMVPHTGWCSEVGYILSVSQGQHLVTRGEIQRDAFANWLVDPDA